MSPKNNNFQEDVDEALAQEVYQEEKDAYLAHQVERQLQRELRDEDLARQLARQEERALAAEERRASGVTAANPRPWTWKRVCPYVVPLVIIVVGVGALLFALSKTSSNATVIPFLEDQDDPWKGMKPGDVVKWDSNSGLKLEVINALQLKWQETFQDVITDWNSGPTPKSLQLSVTGGDDDDHDMECEPVDFTSKVCNGNYGDSQWRGINEVLLDPNGYIVATTSKMNDYYLDDASDAQKRYTLCHELGHSFGLPHSDENFFNTDLGNCMDYTTNPAANASPDDSNFEYLRDLYGTLPPSSRRRRQRRLATPQQQQKQQQQQQGSAEVLLSSAKHQQKHNVIPNQVRERLKSVIPQLLLESDLTAGASSTTMKSHTEEEEEQSWRLLFQSEQDEVYSVELGNGGWKVKVHKILLVEV